MSGKREGGERRSHMLHAPVAGDNQVGWMSCKQAQPQAGDS